MEMGNVKISMDRAAVSTRGKWLMSPLGTHIEGGSKFLAQPLRFQTPGLCLFLVSLANLAGLTSREAQKENTFVQKHMTCLVPLEDIPI